MIKILNKKDVEKDEEFYVQEIIRGKIFIYPTDTLYGIGGNAQIPECAKRILSIKRRNQKPFLIVAPSISWIYKNFKTDKAIRKILKNKLPGSYSFILKIKNSWAVDPLVNNGQDTVGVRIPDNWFSRLIERSGVPFISTSVNLAGEPPATKIEDISQEIIDAVDYTIKDDGSLSGKGSTIIDLVSGEEKIVRP